MTVSPVSDTPDPPDAPVLAELPEQVRARVVALAAEVLPAVPRLPAPVRRVADFAPARRARLGGSAIVDALDDEEFRHQVGIQVAARPASGSDPATDAAHAWLVRPDGWEEAVADAVRRLPDRPVRGDDRAARETERLRARLAEAEQALRDLRAEQRGRLDEIKAENTALRRRLGDTRVAEKEARAAAEQAVAERAAAEAAAEERASSLERENRRLRSQVERLEADAGRVRRDARSERDEATVRARLLLETVIDAAAGLRRELALPAVSGAPADRIEEELGGASTAGGATAASATSPAVLEQLLSMPRARLLVDGYNVSKSAWPASALDAQRTRLVTALAPLVARTSAETTVVFDAAESEHRPPVNAPRGVRVLFSPRGVIADDVLRDLVSAEPAGRVVVVVTADQAVARDVARDGARVVPPEVLLELLAR
ncbi:MAG: NYN domain-containing protein [Nocardioides sp.]|nr:NYN domain-containing protein [Nocardioidaceae bacterium]MCB8956158.1 NYN domain-containing protein [Nocardioides sp.]